MTAVTNHNEDRQGAHESGLVVWLSRKWRVQRLEPRDTHSGAKTMEFVKKRILVCES